MMTVEEKAKIFDFLTERVSAVNFRYKAPGFIRNSGSKWVDLEITTVVNASDRRFKAFKALSLGTDSENPEEVSP